MPNNPQPITGVSTSVTAFIGACVTGPVNQPIQVQSFVQFQTTFGGFSPGRDLAWAMWQFFINGGQDSWVVRIPDAASAADWLGAIKALDAVALFNLLVLPGMTDPAIVKAAIEYGARRRAFVILDAPRNAKVADLIRERAERGAWFRSANAAMFYPWVEVGDPQGGATQWLSAPSGSVAGLFTATDGSRGVWKAAAGTQAAFAGVLGLEYSVSDIENARLNLAGINCIRTFPVYGALLWGARTLAGSDAGNSVWKYVPVRRLALFLESSLYQGTQWAVFQPNAGPLWTQLRLNVGTFMQTLFKLGAFQGATPDEAYFVQYGPDTITQDDIDLGIVNIVVGFAPLYPAEFVIIQIQQMAGQTA